MPAVAIGPRITSYPPVQDRAMPDRYSSGPDYSQPMVLLYIIYICYVYSKLLFIIWYCFVFYAGFSMKQLE